MILTENEKQAVRNGEAVWIRDEDVECVLLRADIFSRVQTLLYDDRDLSHSDLRQLLSKSAEANGWNAPEMDAYDRYDEEIQKRCP